MSAIILSEPVNTALWLTLGYQIKVLPLFWLFKMKISYLFRLKIARQKMINIFLIINSLKVNAAAPLR